MTLPLCPQPPDQAPPSSEKQTAAAIQQLAVRGAYIVLPDEEACGETLAVMLRGQPARKPRTVPTIAFQRARRYGWVVADAEGSRLWRISLAGLEAVRRARSEPQPPSSGIGRGSTASRAKADRDGSSPQELRNLDIDRPGFDPDESPLAWLRSRKDKDGQPMISAAEFQAGERLRADFWRSHMTPRTTMDWSRLGMGGHATRSGTTGSADITDSAAAAQSRIAAALAAVGSDFSGVLVDTCAHLKGLSVIEQERGWPQRSGKIVLLFALRALARHYGYIGDQNGHRQSTEVRHRPADDHRPSLDLRHI